MSTKRVKNVAVGWIRDLLVRIAGKRIAVVGDLMLDEWLWGNVQRISPEAPVPVVEVKEHTFTLGGSGNVANNLAALGAKVSLIGIIGDDTGGARVLSLCRKLEIDAAGIARVHSRPTTRKTRIVAHNQQVVRADREATAPIDAHTRKALRRSMAALDGSLDAVVISDYGKGLVSRPLVETVRRLRGDVVITGDPKPQNIDAFAGIDCIAPNAAEAGSVLGIDTHADPDLARAGRMLLRRTGARYVLITRGEHGMTLFPRRGAPFHVNAVARQVYDVSGAGDTVISTVTAALAAGAPIQQAVALATLAAGIVVEKVGTATASPEEIEKFAEHEGVASPQPFLTRPSRRRARAGGR